MKMGSSLVELQGDIDELKKLLQGNVVESMRIRGLLQRELMMCEQQLVTVENSVPKPLAANEVAAAASPSEDKRVEFCEISKFGWEDEGYGKDKVSVHIMSGIDGVGSLPKENITCDFTDSSFDLKIHGLNGKNYRLNRNHLDKEIDPTRSSYNARKNRVTITLWKTDRNASWMNLTQKNPGSTSKKAASADPSAGLMDMMKQMYDDGDAEMKKTIAKAWTESRSKGGAAGNGGMMPGMM